MMSVHQWEPAARRLRSAGVVVLLVINLTNFQFSGSVPNLRAADKQIQGVLGKQCRLITMMRFAADIV